MIFEYDNQENFTKIIEDFNNINQLKESLANYRGLYRNFAGSLGLNETILIDCIDRYETGLLISCYTFSEQLTKSFFYELIDKDNHSNKYVNSFINNKVHVDKFSPNVKITGINSLLKEVDRDFTFIITSFSRTEFKKYDEMVKSRHQYAHANRYAFNFEQFPEVISVLEYLNFEYEMHIFNEIKREEMRLLYNEIKELATKDMKSGKNFNFANRNMKDNLSNLKKKSRFFMIKYKNLLQDIVLFKEPLIYLEKISLIDLRKTKDSREITDLLKNFSDIV